MIVSRGLDVPGPGWVGGEEQTQGFWDARVCLYGCLALARGWGWEEEVCADGLRDKPWMGQAGVECQEFHENLKENI